MAFPPEPSLMPSLTGRHRHITTHVSWNNGEAGRREAEVRFDELSGCTMLGGSLTPDSASWLLRRLPWPQLQLI